MSIVETYARVAAGALEIARRRNWLLRADLTCLSAVCPREAWVVLAVHDNSYSVVGSAQIPSSAEAIFEDAMERPNGAYAILLRRWDGEAWVDERAEILAARLDSSLDARDILNRIMGETL